MGRRQRLHRQRALTMVSTSGHITPTIIPRPACLRLHSFADSASVTGRNVRPVLKMGPGALRWAQEPQRASAIVSWSMTALIGSALGVGRDLRPACRNLTRRHMSVLGRGRAGRIRASSIASERPFRRPEPLLGSGRWTRADGREQPPDAFGVRCPGGMARDLLLLRDLPVFGGGGVALTSLARRSWSSKSTSDGQRRRRPGRSPGAGRMGVAHADPDVTASLAVPQLPTFIFLPVAASAASRVAWSAAVSCAGSASPAGRTIMPESLPPMVISRPVAGSKDWHLTMW